VLAPGVGGSEGVTNSYRAQLADVRHRTAPACQELKRAVWSARMPSAFRRWQLRTAVIGDFSVLEGIDIEATDAGFTGHHQVDVIGSLGGRLVNSLRSEPSGGVH